MVRHYLVLLLLGCVARSNASPQTTKMASTTENSAQMFTPSKTAQFRNDYVYIKEYDSFYKFHYLKKNFTRAMLTCMEEGATLLIPSSKMEILNVVNRISSNSSLWIGIHNIFHDDVFYTAEGDSLNEDFNLEVDFEELKRFRDPHYYNQERAIKLEKHCLYANAQNPKRNKSANETFVIYQTKECSDEYQYICKKMAKTIVYNKVCDNYDMFYVRADFTDSCYKLHTMQKNWTEAFKTCSVEQANLVEINSAKEANFLINRLSKIPKNEQTLEFVHAGFSDLIIDGIFTTNSGQFLSNAGYEQWANGHPTKTIDVNGVGGSCGAFSIKGELMTTNCQVKAKFICEKKINNE